MLNEKNWSWIFPPNGRRNVKVTFEKPIHLASLEEGSTFDVNADLVNGMKPYNFKVIEKEGSLITASADVEGKPNEQVILVIGFGKSKTRFSFFYDDGGTTYVDHNVIAMYDVLLPKEPTK